MQAQHVECLPGHAGWPLRQLCRGVDRSSLPSWEHSLPQRGCPSCPWLLLLCLPSQSLQTVAVF